MSDKHEDEKDPKAAETQETDPGTIQEGDDGGGQTQGTIQEGDNEGEQDDPKK